MGEIILQYRADREFHYSGGSPQAKIGKEIAIARLRKDHVSLQTGVTGIHKIKILLEELLFRIIASPSSRARAWSYTEI
ncbi:hypothetical protein C8R21_13222 [Nitrosospira multiformis]|uniref:Uncharacterized protein n=1 Tax=Nitrosospira multiformis TaxID=1231 RepID=A0A2T5I5W4_9PROT|nr:hypothetical protein C8R21_13222 [Nitrosospira multiformis]